MVDFTIYFISFSIRYIFYFVYKRLLVRVKNVITINMYFPAIFTLHKDRKKVATGKTGNITKRHTVKIKTQLLK